MTPAQAARLAAARRMAMLPTPIRIVLDDYAALAGALGDLALLPGLRQQVADRDAAIAAQVQVIARLEADLAERKAARVEEHRKRLAERAVWQAKVATYVDPAPLLAKIEHLNQKIAHLQSELPKCRIDGCDKPVHAQQVCSAHYTASRRLTRPTYCPQCGASRTTPKPGLCRVCWYRKVEENKRSREEMQTWHRT